VSLRPVAAVRLECALRHNTALLISVKNLCLEASFKYNGFSPKGLCGKMPHAAGVFAFTAHGATRERKIFLPGMSRCTAL
jgi:hypothetical protein